MWDLLSSDNSRNPCNSDYELSFVLVIITLLFLTHHLHPYSLLFFPSLPSRRRALLIHSTRAFSPCVNISEFPSYFSIHRYTHLRVHYWHVVSLKSVSMRSVRCSQCSQHYDITRLLAASLSVLNPKYGPIGFHVGSQNNHSVVFTGNLFCGLG